jgi:hypothetical protein
MLPVQDPIFMVAPKAPLPHVRTYLLRGMRVPVRANSNPVARRFTDVATKILEFERVFERSERTETPM